MTRKDNEKEAERPHYYSQFWLDIAAGRRVIGGPKPGEEADTVEPEPEPVVLPRKGIRPIGQNDHAESDGHHDTIVHPMAHTTVAPVTEPEEFVEPEPDEIDIQDNEIDTDLDLDVDDGDIPDMDLSADAEEEEEDELFDDEEDEEDDDWGGRGRKKPKPTRPVKPPIKKPKRDPRRY